MLALQTDQSKEFTFYIHVTHPGFFLPPSYTDPNFSDLKIPLGLYSWVVLVMEPRELRFEVIDSLNEVEFQLGNSGRTSF